MCKTREENATYLDTYFCGICGGNHVYAEYYKYIPFNQWNDDTVIEGNSSELYYCSDCNNVASISKLGIDPKNKIN